MKINSKSSLIISRKKINVIRLEPKSELKAGS